MHRRLDDRVVGTVAGGQHAVQQGHHDEAAAETEQHRRHTTQAAEAGKQYIEHRDESVKWAAQLHISLRSFNRRFHRVLGDAPSA